MNSPYDELKRVFAALRHPDTGCPWDLEQTHASLARFAIEEAYEVVDAIEHGTTDDLRDELGDLLLQVALHSQIASENGDFDLDDVAQAINAKMIRRHPHVFADKTYASLDEQKRDWESIKQQERSAAVEKPSARLLEGVSRAQPALQRAHQLQKRAASVGFDWSEPEPVFAKIEEEMAEIRDALEKGESPSRIQEEIGDLLFATVNLARHLGVHAEEALRLGNNKFETRFASVEDEAARGGKELAACSLEEMELWWQQSKKDDRSV